MAHPIYNQNLGLIGILAQAGTPTDCIVFTGESSDFTLAVGSYGAKEWDGTVEYSTDRTTWVTWDGTAISSSNKKLYLRGSGNTTFYTSNGARFVLSAKAGCSGNLNTLLEYSNPPTVLSASNCYAYMFLNCTNLTEAPSILATTLASYCCIQMFYGCTSLTTAPALPATTLASYCYAYMFGECTSLTTAPALPATTLADNCYESMFWGCTGLTTAPALPATTLATRCYYQMFYNCTGFNVASSQYGKYQYAWRIPTSGTISSTPSSWNTSMLINTGGEFRKDPSINTTYYVENEPV